jgi:hypothetical protein
VQRALGLVQNLLRGTTENHSTRLAQGHARKLEKLRARVEGLFQSAVEDNWSGNEATRNLSNAAARYHFPTNLVLADHHLLDKITVAKRHLAKGKVRRDDGVRKGTVTGLTKKMMPVKR